MHIKEQTLTLRELVDLLRRALPVMLLAGAICCGGLFGVGKLAVSPLYASQAAVYILPNTGEEAGFGLALAVTQDCAYLLRSRTVLETVIEEQKLELTWKQLQNRTSVQNPVVSRVLEISVRMDSPETAKAVADGICRVGAAQVDRVLGEPLLKQIEPGSLETAPCNTTPAAAYLLAALAGAGLVYGFVLIRRLYW